MPSPRTLLVLLATFAGAASIPGGAHAAWAPPIPLTGPSAQLGLVGSGEAGRVAVAGTAVDGSLQAAAHVPGGAFGVPAAVAAGSEDIPALIGTGGAIAAFDGDRPTVRRLHADGSVSGPTTVGGPDDVIVAPPALAPSGALLVVVTDSDGHTQLLRQAGEGQPAVPVSVSVPDDALASIAETGADRFLVGVAAPNDGGAPGVQIRTITVDGTTGVPGPPVETTAGVDDFPSDIRIIPAADPAVVYSLSTDTTAAVKVASATAPAPQTLGSGDVDSVSFDTLRGASTAAGLAIAWTLSDADGNPSTGFAVRPSASQPGCVSSVALDAADIVDRSGPTLVGLRSDGAVAIGTTDAACAAPALHYSPVVDEASDITAAVDADATVLALVGQADSGTSTVLADDVTGPVLGDPQVPAAVRTGAPFGVAIEATDPWGLAGVSWTADGRRQGSGRAVTIEGLATGTHRVEATATDAAGLTAKRGADVEASEDAPIPPPPTQPVGDLEAPVISGVALQASIFAPRSTLPRGSSVRFTLSEDARVRMTILRQAVRRSGGASRCIGRGAATASPGKGRVLTVTRDLRAGPNALAITGRDAKGRRLPRGRYRVSLRAADRAANLSAIRYVRFTLC